MSDYDATPRKKKQPIYYIHGQSEQLCRDVHAADEAGVSYGVYMGCLSCPLSVLRTGKDCHELSAEEIERIIQEERKNDTVRLQ